MVVKSKEGYPELGGVGPLALGSPRSRALVLGAGRPPYPGLRPAEAHRPTHSHPPAAPFSFPKTATRPPPDRLRLRGVLAPQQHAPLHKGTPWGHVLHVRVGFGSIDKGAGWR